MWLTLTLLLLTVTFAWAQEPPKQTGVIRGRILDLEGAPLRKAEVTLEPVQPQSGRVYAANTAADGSFALEGIPAAAYRLRARRSGYIQQTYGARAGGAMMPLGTTLRLEPGQVLDGINLTLTPQAVITGVITDEDGDPVENMPVQLLREMASSGGRQPMPVRSQDVSNEVGEFRIAGIAPGTYYLCADRHSGLGGREEVVRNGPEETFPATYFPGTLDAAEAKAIEVTAGAKLRGFDLQLKKVRAYRVRGRVVLPDDANPRFLNVQLLPTMAHVRSFVGGIGGGGGMNFRQDSTFDLGGILPGSYELMVSCNAGNRSLNTRMPVEVKDRNIEGLVVTFAPVSSIAIEGVVRAARPSPEFNPIGIHVALRNLGAKGTGPGAPAQRNGAFVLQAVSPGKYRVEVFSETREGYLKSVRYQGREAGDHTIEIAEGATGAKLELTMAFDGGEVSGMVEDSAGRPVPGAIVLVNRVSAEEWCACNRIETTDQNGHYQVRGIEPGEYRVAAVAPGDVDTVWRVGRKHEEGTKVSIAPDGRVSLTLKTAEK